MLLPVPRSTAAALSASMESSAAPTAEATEGGCRALRKVRAAATPEPPMCGAAACLSALLCRGGVATVSMSTPPGSGT